MPRFNWLDVVLVVVLAFSTIQSLRKGFSREIVGLAASLAALVLAMWFYGMAGSYIVPYVGSQRTANLLGFVLVLFAVLVLGWLLGLIVNHFLRTIGLSFFDRLLGGVFGLLRGLLITIAILTAVMAFGPRADNNPTPEAVVHSRIAPLILEASGWFVAIAPMDLKQSFRERYSQVESGLAEYSRTAQQPKQTDKDSTKK